MDARIQQKIAPPVVNNSKDLNDLKMSPLAAKTGGKSNDVDFKNLLMTSNKETRQQREAVKNGDLSGAKNYQEFLESLNKQSQKDGMPKNTLDKDDFLNLFVTQLQNQDPLNPKDGAEMASQLAQFNSLEQMLNLNTTMAEVSQKATQGHTLEFVNFIGKEVSIKDGRARMSHGSLSQADFKLDFPVGRAKLEVRDKQGAVVANRELGTLNEGEHALSWDGRDHKGEKVPDGIYTFAVTAYGKGDVEVPVAVSSRVKITGVNMQDAGSAFYTDLGKIGMSDIVEIGEQGFTIMPGPEGEEDAAALAVKARAAAQAAAQATEGASEAAGGAPKPSTEALPSSEEALAPQNEKAVTAAAVGAKVGAADAKLPQASLDKAAATQAARAVPAPVAKSRPAPAPEGASPLYPEVHTPYATSEALGRYSDQTRPPAPPAQVQARS